ncbi:MAG: Mpo1 family 2-hydroxy fatty acid dioxygenase [Bacteriovorax sp.]
MNRLERYLNEYALSHQNKTNVLIHKICVPAIMFSVLGILKAMPVPDSWPLWLDLSYFAIAGSLIFYGGLKNIRVLLAMALFFVPQVLILEFLRPRFFLLSLFIFVVAWILQFIGHKIEGKRPSFFKDLFFLLIGPVWVVTFFAEQMGIKLIE